MSGFDAELYLRLLAEQLLVDGVGSNPWDDPLLDRARALVAVGIIDADIAQRVVDGYGWANGLRGDRHHRHHRHSSGRQAQPPATVPPARRVVSCNQTIEDPSAVLRVRYVSLAADSTKLAVTWQPKVSDSRQHRRSTRAHHGGPQPITVTDSSGISASTYFSGGGSDDEWRGTYTTDQPLDVASTWIEILGERINLSAQGPEVSVEVQSLAKMKPVERYLEHCLEALGAHRPDPGEQVQRAVQALVDAGALVADDSLVAITLQVADLLAGSHGGPARPAMHRPGALSASAAVSSSRGLPQRWQSLIARQGRADGPNGTVTIGAVTPVFDGVSVAAMELESAAEGFQVSIELSGATGMASADGLVDAATVTFSASDNLGNHYPGNLGGWSGSDDELQGDLEFWPALDPKATELTLSFTAELSRAVITVALNWNAP